jgi:Ca-activated chloride channel family protein
MTFDRPVLLLTLLLVPLVVGVYVLVRRRRQRYAVSFTNLEVLAAVADRPGWRRELPTALGLVAFTALVVAIAGPHVTRNAPIERATVILAVDTSRSMLSEDVRPTRLAAAKAAAQTFLERVPDELRVGVVTFAGDVQVAAFPSHDRDQLRASIRALGPSWGGGTAIGDALARSVELGQEALSEEGDGPGPGSSAPPPLEGAVSVLFLSDGRQRYGILRPAEGARLARAAGIPVFTVAVGAQDGTGGGLDWFRPPDTATLQTIARATGGEFFAASSEEALTSAYADLGSRLGRAPRASEITVAFVGIGAAVLLAAGLLSAGWWPRLP